MNFPLPPLHLEERIELVTSPNTPEVILAIQQEYARYRHLLHRGWEVKYASEVGAWLAWQKKPQKQRS